MSSERELAFEGRYEISILVGPCRESEAEALCLELADHLAGKRGELGSALGAALAVGPAMLDAGPGYPKTPVDCLISELRDLFGMNGRAYLMKDEFDARVAQFYAEVAE